MDNNNRNDKMNVIISDKLSQGQKQINTKGIYPKKESQNQHKKLNL